MLRLGLQQRIDQIHKNPLLKALAINVVIDSLSRAIINTFIIITSLIDTEVLT